MSREIKFRAWYPSVKRMIHFENPSVGCDCENKWAMMLYPAEGHVFIGNAEVMQFTGLHDKNGKEIYEGDVLLYLATNMSSMGVEFQNGCFVGVGPWNTSPLIDYFKATDFESVEVLGNIYQNPELLQ